MTPRHDWFYKLFHNPCSRKKKHQHYWSGSYITRPWLLVEQIPTYIEGEPNLMWVAEEGIVQRSKPIVGCQQLSGLANWTSPFNFLEPKTPKDMHNNNELEQIKSPLVVQNKSQTFLSSILPKLYTSCQNFSHDLDSQKKKKRKK